MSFDIKSVLATIAPTLATMLGGPFAGTAVTALESAFGLAPGSGVEAITKVVQGGAMTPEIIASVRAADQKHAEIMSQQGIDLEKINNAHQEAILASEVSDRNGARQREVAVKDTTPRNLAYTVIGGFLGISILQLVALMFFPVEAAAIPPQGWLLIGNISGYLAGEAKQAGAYYFGNSAGSDEATKLLSQAPAIGTK